MTRYQRIPGRLEDLGGKQLIFLVVLFLPFHGTVQVPARVLVLVQIVWVQVWIRGRACVRLQVWYVHGYGWGYASGHRYVYGTGASALWYTVRCGTVLQQNHVTVCRPFADHVYGSL